MANSNLDPTPSIPIGRLAAISATEVGDYLQKVKEFELLQASGPGGILWQKNALHLIGGSDAGVLNRTLIPTMDRAKAIIEGEFAGAEVQTFVRLNNPNTAANNAAIQNQVSEGTGLLTYFGHSSPTSIDFNLNSPYELSNTGGKYPVFLFNGCSASDFFRYSSDRLTGGSLTISENFTLAKQRGTIAFISSTTFGIAEYLGPLIERWYKAAGVTKYGKGIGDIMQEAIRMTYVDFRDTTDYYLRNTNEQYLLHGDPALKIFTLDKPDYFIDSTSISFSPSHVTMATDSVTIKTIIKNQGKAIHDSVWFELNRTLPNGSKKLILKKKIATPEFVDSISVTIPIVGSNEKGMNYFRATVDSLNAVPEIFENNNAATKGLFIYDNEIVPIIPYKYSILNQWPVTFIGSTVNPGADTITYRMQIDTTNLFNSGLLKSLDVESSGGSVQFNPAFSILDSTVYYWRVSPVTAGIADNWNYSSFTRIAASSDGFDQSHYFQHLNSSLTRIELPASRRFRFDSSYNNLYINHGIYPTSGGEDDHFSVTVNGLLQIFSACAGHSIIFNLFDPVSFQPMLNTPGGGAYQSWKSVTPSTCGTAPDGRQYNFEFRYHDMDGATFARKKIMDFIDWIPKGTLVSARLNLDPDPGQPAATSNFPAAKADSAFAQYWQRDTIIYGSGKSLYHSLVKQGFYNLNQMNARKTFAFVFVKDDSSAFKPKAIMSAGLYDRVTMNVDVNMTDTSGVILSPLFGPAAAWQQMHWRGKSIAPWPDNGSTDSVYVNIYGIDTLGSTTLLKQYSKTQQDEDISDIDANKYPFLQLRMLNSDTKYATPQQLDYWRLNYLPIPEGAISPNLYYTFTKDKVTNLYKDTLYSVDDTLEFGVAFKNIGLVKFNDSIAVSLSLIDANGVVSNIPYKRFKALAKADSVHLYFKRLTNDLDGDYNIHVNFNPNAIQKEVTTANNFMYKKFFVDSAPEGTVDSTLYFDFTKDDITNEYKDTLIASVDPLKFGIAFKNISSKSFSDSIVVSFKLVPDIGSDIIVPFNRVKKLLSGQSTTIDYETETTLMQGWYTLEVTFNPNRIQKEQTILNNSYSHRFYVFSAVLPISLFSFTAEPANSCVKLDWKVVNEQNLDQYNIERSTDGIHFTAIGKLDSRHANQSSYIFDDCTPANGMNYYRIKMTGKDNAKQYSATRQVYFGTQFKVQVMPNPFQGHIKVYVSGNARQVVGSVVNAKGQLMRKFAVQSFAEINTMMLPAGAYWLILNNGTEKTQIKIEKL